MGFRRELVPGALRSLLDQTGQSRDDGGTLDICRLDEAGYEIIATQVRHHHPPGEEDRQQRRRNFLHTEFCAQRSRVHGRAAAECNEGEIAPIETTIDRDELERVDHVVVGDAHDTARRLDCADPQLLGDPARTPTASIPALISPPK